MTSIRIWSIDRGRDLQAVALLFLLAAFYAGEGQCLDVRFDDPTTGFFLRQKSSASASPQLASTASTSSSGLDEAVVPTTSIILGTKEKAKNSRERLVQPSEPSSLLDDILHQESFTVVRSSTPVTVRANYGPFEASQMVPTQYLVPDMLMVEEEENTKEAGLKVKGATLITDFKPHQLDLSAHLVTNEVPKDNPVLRTLFHMGNYHSSLNARICVVLTASLESSKTSRNGNNNNEGSKVHKSVSQICSPRESKDGTCLGQLTLPSSWWPPFTQAKSTASEPFVKQPKVLVDVKYSVFETRGTCDHAANKIPVVPETPLGAVTLSLPDQSYHQLAKDELVHMLMPQAPLYPNSKFYVPVFLEQPLTDQAPITALTIKCRTRTGLRILGVEVASEAWTIRVDVNARGSIATVTAFKKTLQTTSLAKEDSTLAASTPPKTAYGPHELFNWLLVIDDRDYDTWDQPKISWHIKYQRPQTAEHQADEADDSEDYSTDHAHHRSKDSYRLRAKMSVKKDEVQAVIPIAKHKDLMNLAVLTGHQVSRPLKVFIVSQSGEVADVTLDSSCSSADQSVLKVSSSCSSVYVDGSELRGALSAEIDIKYGAPQYMGKAVFTVWMPETPLNIDVSDTRLSQIKGWKVPGSQSNGKRNLNETSAADDVAHAPPLGEPEESQCHMRYQQAAVRVFAKFLAQDSDSGRTEYFPSRTSELDVTDLVKLRISNSGVASLSKNVVQGISPGRAEIKVVSPITGREIGMREVRVLKNRESIRGMNVRILSGLALNVQADLQNEGRYTVQTSYSQILTSKYQEALLDIELELSDDTKLPLREVDPEDYYLTIKSLDQDVIALAPSRDPRFPRVIAVGSGRGQLLRASLELVDGCMETKSSNLALAVQLAEVNVFLQSKKRNMWSMEKSSDIGNILSNIALRDDHSYYSKSSGHGGAESYLRPAANFDRSSGGSNYFMDGHLTSLEIGMYILLAVFCAAMAVFMASCFVYASKFKREEYPMNQKAMSSLSVEQPQRRSTAALAACKTPVQNAHDWIWLGKSTIDKANSSVHESSRHQTLDSSRRSMLSSSAEVNVITNPHDIEAALGERIPLHQLSSHCSYPKQQYNYASAATYENLRGFQRPARRMQLPQVPTGGAPPQNKRHYHQFQAEITHNPMHGIPDQQPVRRRRQLPKINSATYTKKVAELSKSSPPGILPVGYPVFLPEGYLQEDEELSPMKPLPDPTSFDMGPPLRQSPASALPPLHPSMESISHEEDDVTSVRGEYEPLNPDIDRPSPPRTGAARLFENPFEITDEDSVPVEPEKQLSPSHVFESTSLEQSLLQLEETEEKCSGPARSRSVDSRTFVIRRSPTASNSSRKSSPVTSPQEALSPCSDVNANPDCANAMQDDELALGAEAAKEEDAAMEMDYDNLMAYFENLKESVA